MEGERYLVEDMSLVCGDARWERYSALAVVAIVAYTLVSLCDILIYMGTVLAPSFWSDRGSYLNTICLGRIVYEPKASRIGLLIYLCNVMSGHLRCLGHSSLLLLPAVAQQRDATHCGNQAHHWLPL